MSFDSFGGLFFYPVAKRLFPSRVMRILRRLFQDNMKKYIMNNFIPERPTLHLCCCVVRQGFRLP
jgi:hypothetical protein